MTTDMKQCDYTGGSVYYRMAGPGDGLAIVFIHGSGGDSRLYFQQMQYFSGSYRVIAVDLPGHGKSVVEADPVLEDYACAVEAVIDNEKIDSCVLVGHSMGGGVILELYRRIPRKIAALVFISTAAALPVSDVVFDLAEKDYVTFCQFLVKLSYSKNAPQMFRDLALKELASIDKNIIINDFRICSKFNYEEMLPGIACPALVISNRGDKMVPAGISEALKDGIPGAEIALYDTDGHMAYLEQHEAVNRDIDQFIRDSVIRRVNT